MASISFLFQSFSLHFILFPNLLAFSFFSHLLPFCPSWIAGICLSILLLFFPSSRTLFWYFLMLSASEGRNSAVLTRRLDIMYHWFSLPGSLFRTQPGCRMRTRRTSQLFSSQHAASIPHTSQIAGFFSFSSPFPSYCCHFVFYMLSTPMMALLYVVNPPETGLIGSLAFSWAKVILKQWRGFQQLRLHAFSLHRLPSCRDIEDRIVETVELKH